ncbi:MAG: leucine-rich repeat domain-containing protein [Clostridia bacterium]|nr:leucine-rich repeat domain-containing protein [Clostridia bacterium]
MKKIILAVLIITLLISFCGCGGTGSTEDTHIDTDQGQADNDMFGDAGEPDVQQLNGRLFRSGDYIMHDNGDGTAFIISYEGSDSEVAFPEEIDGLTVTGIWTYSLLNSSSINKLTLPKSIKTTAYCALTSSVLESIEVDEANPYLKSIEGVLYSKDGRTLICYPGAYCARKFERKFVLPDSVTTIAAGAFWYDFSLLMIEVGSGNKSFKSVDGVLYTKDGKTVVWYPAGKQNIIVHLADGVTGIARYAFVSARNIEQIIIPASVEHIATNAFLQCTALRHLTVDENNPYFYSDEGAVLYNKDKTELIFYPPARAAASFSFLDGITKIGDYACFSSRFIDKCPIPDTVTEIGFDAFKYCSWLDVVDIPASLKRIGENAFADCDELLTINYAGTKAQWEAIEKGAHWKSGTTPEITVQCSDGNITEQ